MAGGKYLKPTDCGVSGGVYTIEDRRKDVIFLAGLSQDEFIKECLSRWDRFLHLPCSSNYSRFSTASSLAKELGIEYSLNDANFADIGQKSRGTEREF